jgi:hypothetical protein
MPEYLSPEHVLVPLFIHYENVGMRIVEHEDPHQPIELSLGVLAKLDSLMERQVDHVRKVIAPAEALVKHY